MRRDIESFAQLIRLKLPKVLRGLHNSQGRPLYITDVSYYPNDNHWVISYHHQDYEGGRFYHRNSYIYLNDERFFELVD